MPTSFIPCPQATTALSAEREAALVLLAQHGRRDALDELVLVHHECLWQVARTFSCPDMAPGDIFAVAYDYFREKAVITYRSGRGTRLWTWTCGLLHRKLRDACVKANQIPDKVRRCRPSVLAAQATLTQLLEHEPTVRELAEWVDEEEALVKAVLQSGLKVVSLSAGETDAEPGGVAELAAPGRSADARLVLADACQAICKVLGDRVGIKFLVLWLLREYGGYEWKVIVAMLSDDFADEPVWRTAQTDLILPTALHVPWTDACQLFSGSPPRLTEVNLRDWYGRQLGLLSSASEMQEFK